MAITFVQKTASPANGSSITSLAVTVPANVTAGNAVFVIAATGSVHTLSFATGMGVDTAAWAQAVTEADGSGNSSYIWYGLNSAGGAGSVTGTISGAAGGFDFESGEVFGGATSAGPD